MKPIAKKARAKPAVKKTVGTPVDKLVIGKTYGYTSRTVGAEQNARGKVMEVYRVATGPMVTLYDKQRDKTVTVRPSQVTK